MTGEISLQGNVLPIGGVEEKIRGAILSGCKRVFIPKENKKNVEEIEEKVIKLIHIIYVETINEVLTEAFHK
jgi:ATP-dependent Lon protease